MTSLDTLQTAASSEALAPSEVEAPVGQHAGVGRIVVGNPFLEMAANTWTTKEIAALTIQAQELAASTQINDGSI